LHELTPLHEPVGRSYHARQSGQQAAKRGQLVNFGGFEVGLRRMVQKERSYKWVGWLALATSLALNAGLLWTCVEFYRREQGVRIYPTFPIPEPRASVPGRPLVLFLGDSRMQEWPDLPSDRFVTVNAGGGGETTAQIRLRSAQTLDTVRPEIVILQAGTNDLKALGALPELAVDIEARLLVNLTALVELCRARSRVVIVPILPAASPSLVRRLVWSSEIEAARVRINSALRKRYTGVSGITILDEHLLDPDRGDYRDTLHFTPSAYVKLEAAALKAIAAQ
jgi:lysophospholipase L1-like esterase